MTKQEYNEALKRFHKGMKWYDNSPSIEQQEKFYGNFTKVLAQLTEGYKELNPKGKEILEGFGI